MKQNNQGRITDLSITAFILSILGITSLIGAVLGIIDVSQKDGRSKGLSVAAITIGIVITAVLCTFFLMPHTFMEEEEAGPPVTHDYSLPNAPVYGPEITPSPSPTETPEEMTL